MKKNKVEIEINELNNSCFVVMPFSNMFEIEYQKVIKPTLFELGIECVRGDEIYTKQRIMDDIWASIRKCRFVIAELTGRNPNVLYEIGLAHAIGKPVIIVTRNGEDVPFDLKDLRYLYYDVSDPFWGENLKIGLKSLIEKVLQSPEIGSYLEGISNEFFDFPKLEKPKMSLASAEEEIDITGIWNTVFYSESAGKHDMTVNIIQTGNDLTATAVISLIEDGKLLVIQEILNGRIKNGEISLQGVNYSFIKHDDSPDYDLDSFNLKAESETKLKGIWTDDFGSLEVIWKKNNA